MQTNTSDIKLTIGDTAVCVEWEDNDSVAEIAGLLADGPITVSMSEYGGFEAVGDLPRRISSSDRQTDTAPGDIVLYSSRSIVIFYGSNSWAYTRLGKVTDLDAQQLKTLLSSGNDITLSLG